MPIQFDATPAEGTDFTTGTSIVYTGTSGPALACTVDKQVPNPSPPPATTWTNVNANIVISGNASWKVTITGLIAGTYRVNVSGSGKGDTITRGFTVSPPPGGGGDG